MQIVARTSIGHHCVTLPQQINIEATTIQVHGALVSVLVVSVYKPNAELLVSDLDVIFDTWLAT